LIKSIAVAGHGLGDVEAAVSSNDNAMTVLGLPALNRLGPFKISDGKLVFTSEGRPT
jgi:predicted aspartyl protease